MRRRTRSQVATLMVGPTLLACDGAIADSVDTPPIKLTDVTVESGLSFIHTNGAAGERWMPETLGSGVAFLDYDGDGLQDVYLVNGSSWRSEPHEDPSTDRLFKNDGAGGFVDVTNAAGLSVPSYGMGVTAADFDADGDVDLYLTAVGENRLLRNDLGRFVDVTGVMGLSGEEHKSGTPWSTAAVWFDADRDGWLDLFSCNYVVWSRPVSLGSPAADRPTRYSSPEAHEGSTCRFYRSRQGGSFEDATSRVGLENASGKTLGLLADDFDGDGWADLFVANDLVRNFLYRNQRDGTFEDLAVDAGVAYDEFFEARAGMGLDVSSVTGRPQLSIAIGNFDGEPVSLHTQVGEWRFQDLTRSAGLWRATLPLVTFGLAFADLDLDGFQDLLLANGHVEPSIRQFVPAARFEQPPSVFRNNGRGAFENVTESVGPDFGRPIAGRGLAVADFDDDGDWDVLVTTNGGRPKLFRNDTDRVQRPARVRIRGRHPNEGAIGAVVWAFAGDLRQRFAVRSSSSYLSQSQTNPLLIAFDQVATIDSIRVHWPDGLTSVHSDIPVGHDTTLNHPRRDAS